MSQKSATVAENGETTAKFGDCRTFLRQCGHVGFNLYTVVLGMDVPQLQAEVRNFVVS